MATIKQSSIFNLPQDGKLGFQSDIQFNWRDNPNVVHCRQFVLNTIQMYLSQNATGDFKMAIPQLALSLENQILLDAISQEDYMDQAKLFDRIRILIMRKWHEVKSDQQIAIHNNNLLPMYTSTPTVRMMKNDLGPSFNRGLPDYSLTADNGFSVAYPGSRKRSFSGTPQPSEHMLPNICSPQDGFSCPYPVESSGPTFSGSVLQYDSEASFESHCTNSRYFSEGELNLIVSSNHSSPSVQMPSIMGEIPKVEVPVFCNDAQMQQQPLLELPQPEEQLHQPKALYDDVCSKKAESLATVSGQNKNSSATQDAIVRPIILSDVQRRTFDKLLSCYILYNKNSIEHKMPFLEFWHSRNCTGGACNCESNRMVLSHFDTCGSSDCGICAPAVRTHGSDFGISVGSDTSGDLLHPAKCRRLNASSVRRGSFGSPVDSSCRSETLNVDSESPVVTSDNPESIAGIADSHAEDHTGTGQAADLVVDVAQGSNSDDVTGPAECQLADFQEELQPASPHELKDMGFDVAGKLLADSAPSLCEDPNFAQGGKVVTRNGLENIEQNEVRSIVVSTEPKSEKQKDVGISLIDFFTAEEIRQHISGLRQKSDQVVTEEEFGNTVTGSVSENFCQLCTMDRLSFPPMPIYCSRCGVRVKNYQSYYSTKDDRAQLCFCNKCYNTFRGSSNITFSGFSVSKNDVELKKHNLVTDESWVQCDKCEGWQHQICSLFNDKRDLGGKAEFICPKCHLEDLGTGKRMPLPRTTSMDASNLPRTLLSDHLEQRLFRRLHLEREQRAKAAGKSPEEVPYPDDLVVRVVSSVDKRLKVMQQFLDIFPEKNYPSEFPYRSKVGMNLRKRRVSSLVLQSHQKRKCLKLKDVPFKNLKELQKLLPKVSFCAKKDDRLTIRRIVSFVFELAKCDMDYDVRDRAQTFIEDAT